MDISPSVYEHAARLIGVTPWEASRNADRPDIRIRVNCDLRIIAAGRRGQIRAEADRVIRLIGDRPNTTLGTGALPYEANPDNVCYVMDYVRRIER